MRTPLERLSCKAEETLKGIPPEVRYTEQFSASRFIFAAGAFSLFRCVAVGLIVIAMSGFLVVKGKFAYIVIHGAVEIEDIGLVVIGEGTTYFSLTRCVGSILRPVIAAKLGFFKFVRVVVSGEAALALIARQLAAELFNRPIFGRVSFLCPVDYRVAIAALG